mmetsp:Transcript_83452/g.232774  ORF Transcript_83452/g.232774 Transcript_83452/m.232774 type:complete len:265 (-) Transcript_83452:479-1273(-)
MSPELRRGLADNDARGPPKERTWKLGHIAVPLLLYQIASQLHDNKIALLHGRNGMQYMADTKVVERLQVEIQLRLVLRCDVSIATGSVETALLAPSQDCAVAELCVPRVGRQKQIQPIEGAFIRQTDGEKHLVFTILRRLGGCDNLNVRLLGGPNHSAPERKGLNGLRAEVRVNRQIFERDRRKQGLAFQRFWQRLGVAETDAASEEAHGVIIRIFFIEVQEHRDYGVAREPLLAQPFLRLPAGDQGAIRFEANAVWPVAQKQA